MKKTILIVFLFIIYCDLYTYANPGSGGEPGDFLTLGAGARVLSMGGTFCGLADDGSAIVYNPAGLDYLSRIEITTNYVGLFEDTFYGYLGIVYPTYKSGTFGIGNIFLTSGGFQQRTNYYDEGTEFSQTQDAIFIAYGRRLFPYLSLGTSLKIISHSIYRFNATGVGCDLGFLYKPKDWLSVGVNFHNIIPPKIKLNNTTDTYLFKVKLGTAIKIFSVFPKTFDQLSLVSDYEFSSWGNHLNMGFEYGQFWSKNSLYFRLGRDFSRGAMNIGTGLNIKRYKIDLGVGFMGLGASFRVSFSCYLGKEIEKQTEMYTRWKALRKAKQLYIEGLRSYNEDKYVEALKLWENALIFDPENTTILTKFNEATEKLESKMRNELLGKAIGEAYSYYEKGDIISSLEAWAQVLKIDPTSIRAKDYTSKINNMLTKKQKEEYLLRVEKKKSQRIGYLISKADLAFKQRRFKDALAFWRKIKKLAPGNIQAEKNISALKKKIRELIQYHYDKGLISFKKGQYKNAVKELKQVVYYQPHYKDADDLLKKATKKVKSSLVTKKEKAIDKLYYEAADLYLKGKYKETVEILQKLLEIDPTNENAIKLLNKAKSVLLVLKKSREE